jgi:predicted lipid-binding transport protein (Tim44 family)
MSRWMGPMAGLAAGLGLAWLASSLGLSEALMSALMIGLAVVAGIVLIRFLLARRTPSRPGMPYAGAGAGLGQRPGGYETQVPPASNSRFEPLVGGAGSTPSADASRGRYPPGFDPAPFLKQARLQFNQLQAAYDAGDRAMLADVMTPELFAEVSQDLDARRSHVPTEVVALNPELVEVTTEGDQHWASVRFRGLIREDGGPLPKPFDEMWNLVKPADGSSGWQLAGIRQLDSEPMGHA